MTDEERFKFFRDFISWKHEGLDIEKQRCLYISFGLHMKLESTQIRRVIVIFFKSPWIYKFLIKNLNTYSTYHDIPCRMKLESEITLLDPFFHTKQDKGKLYNFDFIRKNSSTEKVTIDETFCTLVTVGEKFLEKKAFKKVLKKIDEIRRIIRIWK